ncbi:MAG: sigma-70 family RNA polymerase sigma factor [Verrucomicrobiota bacterium]|nr:sigma-70 family RNA polymerase sigma factor [Verrucomicrobiota bacterium]
MPESQESSENPIPVSSPKTLSEMNDIELVALVKDGKTNAYDELINRYKGKIYSTIYNMTSNHEDTNDLMLEVFEKAYFSIEKFKGKSSFSTWIYQITKNHVINFCSRRKNQSDKNFSLNEIEMDDENRSVLKELVSPENTDRDVNINELQKNLNESLQKLSNEHRLTVVLHDVEGKTSGEIGAIMGCSEGTVRSRLHYARQQLQNSLKKYL